jgi:hypothetical protein
MTQPVATKAAIFLTGRATAAKVWSYQAVVPCGAMRPVPSPAPLPVAPQDRGQAHTDNPNVLDNWMVELRWLVIFFQRQSIF